MESQPPVVETISPPLPADRFARSWNILFWGTVITLGLVLLFETLLKPFTPIEFLYLARNMVAGRLSVDDIPNIRSDYVVWQGHIYLPMGPLPAVILIPFLPLIQLGMPPAWISVIMTGVNVWLFYRIFTRLGTTGETRRWALLLFFGGTVYFGLAATMNSWYFAQVVGTTFLLAAILEAVGGRRLVLVGLFIGLAGCARITYLFALPFFLWLFWVKSWAGRWRGERWMVLGDLALLGLGLGIPILLLIGYNYARFGNFLETGYDSEVVSNADLEYTRSFGLFSVVHIPTNLYYLFLQGPVPYPYPDSPLLTFPYVQPTPMGMGIFFTTPALLYVFRARLRDPIVTACWLGIAAISIPLLTYEATGWLTFGDRYTLDLLPFAVLVAAYGLPNPLNNRARGLIILSAIINLWGTYWIHAWLTPRS